MRFVAALAAILLPVSSFAQPAAPEPPPPEFAAVDGNGVDLTTGGLRITVSGASVGSLSDGGLVRVTEGPGGHIPDNFSGGVSADIAEVSVSLGQRSERFGIDYINGGGFASFSGTGRLTQADGKYYYTLADGTRATYDEAKRNAWAQSALLVSIEKPNGEKLTHHYVKDSSHPDCGPAPNGHCQRLQAVVSNRGYMMKYEYHGNELPLSRVLKSVTAINLAHEYCDPVAPTCTLTNTWSKRTYAGDLISQTAPLTVTDSLGRTTTYVRNNYMITRIETSAGVYTDYTYYPDGRVKTVTKAGGTWNYAYGINQTAPYDFVAEVRDPFDKLRRYTTDGELKRIKEFMDADGAITTFTLEATSGRILSVISPEQSRVDYVYNSRGLIESITKVGKSSPQPLPNYVTSYAYAACTQANWKVCYKPTAVTEGGATTNYTYDNNHGGVLTVTEPPGATGVRPQTRYTYSSYGAVIKDATGALVAQPATIAFARLSSACRTLAACSNNAAEEKRVGHYFGGETAANNRQVVHTTVYAAGTTLARIGTFTYSKQGDLIGDDGPRTDVGDKTAYRYDSERQLIGELGIDPDGSGPLRAVARKYQYRTDGRVDFVEVGTVASQSDNGWAGFQASERVTYAYDSAGRKVRETTTAGGVTQTLVQYTYDAAGRLDCQVVRMNPAAFGSAPASACVLGTTGTQGPDRIAKYTYDGLDRQNSVTVGFGTADARTESVVYNASGTTRHVEDGRGYRTTYVYDAHDRLWLTYFPSKDAPGTAAPNDYTELFYDNTTWDVSQERRRGGEMVGFTYDGRHNVVATTAGSATYDFDNFNRLMSASEAGRTIATQYDALDRVVSETGPLGAVQYQYNVASQRTRLTWPDGFYVTYDLDNTGAVKAIRENGAAALATFTYDNLGRRQNLTRGNGVQTGYGYDAASRLSSLTNDLAGTDRDQTLTFGFNAAGQIATRTSNNPAYAWGGLFNVNLDYTNNGLNQVTAIGATPLTYSPRGNLSNDGVSTYVYDLDNRLESAGNGTTLSYDPDGRLYQLVEAGSTTRFLYDGQDLIAEYDGAGTLLRRYVHGPETDEPLVSYNIASPSDRRWLTADHQGSIVSISDDSGLSRGVYTYNDYGVPSDVAGAEAPPRFRYTGQTWIPSLSLYNYKARIYSATLGRFLQPDPIDLEGGMNLYAYVGGDPVNLLDPTGLLGESMEAIEATFRSTEIVVTANCVRVEGMGCIPRWQAEEHARFLIERQTFHDHHRRVGDQNPLYYPAHVVAALQPTGTGGFLLKAGFGIAGKVLTKACNCFEAGTLVATPTGLKPIESLQVGDSVLSRDPATDERDVKVVTGLIRGAQRPIYALTIESIHADGRRSREVVHTTEEHPFRTDEGEWTEAANLTTGVEIVTGDGRVATVVSVVDSGRSAPTFNLEVEGAHTYFVGRAGLWAHNSCLPKFARLVDHARRHSTLSPAAYHKAAAAHANTGSKFKFYHDGQFKSGFVTRTGSDAFTFTSTSTSGNRIFTHMEVNTQYLRNIGITLPRGF